MKKLGFLMITVLLISFSLQAQDKRVKGENFSRNAIYIQVLGPTIPGSLNFERIITKNAVFNFGARVGGFYAPFNQYNELKVANGTFELMFLFGRSAHMFEMGLGWSGHYGSFYSEQQQKTRFYGVPTSNFDIGYRFQKPEGGVFFRCGLTATTILAFATNDLKELAIGNAALFGLELLTGSKPSFSMPSVAIGYTF